MFVYILLIGVNHVFLDSIASLNLSYPIVSSICHNNSDWKLQKEIVCRSVGWSVLDVDYSGDGRFLVYSTWSPSAQLCNATGDHDLHEACDFRFDHRLSYAMFHCPDALLYDRPTARRFALFSVKFSGDNRELLGGSSDANVSIYDLERKDRVQCIIAHRDDVNTVAWADKQSQVFISGSDDTLCKVWDRRVLLRAAADAKVSHT
jgi:WD repeat-containing protein 23